MQSSGGEYPSPPIHPVKPGIKMPSSSAAGAGPSCLAPPSTFNSHLMCASQDPCRVSRPDPLLDKGLETQREEAGTLWPRNKDSVPFLACFSVPG